jgi:predicted lipoprotein with Yx(FWY)xxD motif
MTNTHTHPRSWTRSSGPRPTWRRAAFPAMALAIAALLSACGSGGGSGSATASTTTTTGKVDVRSTSLGPILTDSAGQTLYAFAADKKGVSHCSGSCLTYWPPTSPTTAPQPGAGVTAHLGTITGTDGKKQLTVDGWPMYTYVGDSGPGDTTGQGLNESGGLWWAVSPDGTWVKTSAGSSPSSSSSSGGGGY